jgi:hypothetical protein
MFLTSNAQIKVNSNGSCELGSNIKIVTTEYPMFIDLSSTNVNYGGTLGFNNPWSLVSTIEIIAEETYTQYLTVWSDKSVKTNITPLSYGLREVLKLKPVSYKYNSDFSKSSEKKEKQLGFIAQDLQEVLPEIVQKDERKDILTYRPLDLIPVLANAIREQQSTIEALEKRIAKLESNNNGIKSATISVNEENAISLNTPTLAQNIPNPFSNTTRIDIYLPETVKNAVLYVYNMQGVQIKSFNINERGTTSVTIEGYTLQAGMYLYTLIADGKEVDTKKMILTK